MQKSISAGFVSSYFGIFISVTALWMKLFGAFDSKFTFSLQFSLLAFTALKKYLFGIMIFFLEELFSSDFDGVNFIRLGSVNNNLSLGGNFLLILFIKKSGLALSTSESTISNNFWLKTEFLFLALNPFYLCFFGIFWIILVES